MSRFREEIAEQVAVAERLLELGAAAASTIGERIRETPHRGFVIAARGSSDNAALYAKFRRQLWRVVLVMCGLFIPGCWLWIIYDIQAGPLITVLKWLCGVVIVGSGFGLWRARRA